MNLQVHHVQRWWTIGPLLLCAVVLLFACMPSSSNASKMDPIMNSLVLGDVFSNSTLFREISLEFDAKQVEEFKVADGTATTDVTTGAEDGDKVGDTDGEKDGDKSGDEDGDGDGGDDCATPTLTGYVSQYNFSSFLPDDYDQLAESMQQLDIYHQINSFDDTVQLLERLLKYVFKLGKNRELKELIRYMSAIAFEKFALIDVSPECISELSGISDGIRNFELWAMKFIDSMASIHPVGLFKGRLGAFGDYDQCLGIKGPVRENGKRPIYGQYCQIQTYKVTPPLETYNPKSEATFTSSPLYELVQAIMKKATMETYTENWKEPVKLLTTWFEKLNRTMPVYGVCLPASCAPRDIENLLNQYLYPLLKIPLVVDPLLCDTHPDLKEVKLDNFQKGSIIGLTTIVAILLLCTCYHLYCIINSDEPPQVESQAKSKSETSSLASEYKLDVQKEEEVDTTKRGIHEFIIGFSIVKNTQSLLDTGKDDSRFAVVDTLRVALAYWVFPLLEFNMNNFVTPQLIKNYFDSGCLGIALNDRYWFARMPTIWNDGFVFILGMMLIIQQFKLLNRHGGKFDYLTYICKRWYRLSVSMAGMLMIIYLYPLSGDGPMWYANKLGLVDECKEPSSLLSSFLLYSNWNPVFNKYFTTAGGGLPICNYPTWFNSMSSQLYLVAPLIFLPLYYWPTFGQILLGFSILISPVFTILPRIITGYPTYQEVNKYVSIESPVRAVTTYNLNTCMYATSLTFGLLTGYLIKCKPKLPVGGPLSVLFVWLASLSTVVLAFFWQNRFWEWNVVPDTYEVMGWWILAKVAVSFFLSFTCYVCCTGRGGIIARALTIPALRPIAKLSYGIFLVRYMAIFWRITGIRYQYDMVFFQTFQFIFFDFLTSAALAYVVYILFEAPSMAILKFFENKPSKSIDNINNNYNNNNNKQQKLEEPNLEKLQYPKEA